MPPKIDPNLKSMPWNVKQMIVESADTKTKLRLRHCNKEFKGHIEKSIIVFERLTFYLRGNQYWKATPEQFFFFLKISSRVHVKRLALHFEKSCTRADEHLPELRAAFLKEFHAFLKHLNGKLHVEKLVMENSGKPEEVLQVLPFLEPGTLKSIEFLHQPLIRRNGHVTMDLTEIAETDQWKQAEKWVMQVLNFELPFQKWKHFSSIRYWPWDSVSVENLGEMMEHFIASPSFRRCELNDYVTYYVDCHEYVRFFTRFNPSITSKRPHSRENGMIFKIDAGDFVVKVQLKTYVMLIEKIHKSDYVEETGRNIVRLRPATATAKYIKYLSI